LKKVRANQGWPISLVAATGEIGGSKLSPTEKDLVQKLAEEGVIRPPTIKFGKKTESFLFTPKPGSSRLNAANREVYERAMALISAVRKGQLLPNQYRIKMPVRILETLRDKGYLGSNSEAREQYHNLVVLRVAQLKPVGTSQWQLHLNRTPENLAAISLLRTGSLADMEVNQQARIALSKGEEYIQSLISAKELKSRQRQVIDSQASHETEKNSARANVFRFALELGHRVMVSALRICARSRNRHGVPSHCWSLRQSPEIVKLEIFGRRRF
jgi:hypothetical protein